MRNDYVALTCKKCGGALNPDTMRCPYCGTYHRWEDNSTERVLLEVEKPGIRVYQAGIEVAREAKMYMPIDDFARHVKHKLVQGLIEKGIDENIEMYSEYDIVNMTDRYYGRLRVLEPSYRF